MMFKSFIESTVIFILEALWNFKWLVGAGLAAWILCAALTSWIDDVEEAAKKIHQLPNRATIAQQVNTYAGK